MKFDLPSGTGMPEYALRSGARLFMVLAGETL